MHLDCFFFGPEFASDLLIEHPLGNKKADLPLPLSQGVECFTITLESSDSVKSAY
jgi:hypothetical protein